MRASMQPVITPCRLQFSQLENPILPALTHVLLRDRRKGNERWPNWNMVPSVTHMKLTTEHSDVLIHILTKESLGVASDMWVGSSGFIAWVRDQLIKNLTVLSKGQKWQLPLSWNTVMGKWRSRSKHFKSRQKRFSSLLLPDRPIFHKTEDFLGIKQLR
jgi:hypothetical protein